MSQEKGERYFEMFKTWEATMSDDDFVDIVYPATGKLNRGQIKKLSGVSDEAIKRNSKVKEALDDLESRLRKKGILPPLSEAGKKAQSGPKKYDNTANRRAMDSKRVAVLEAENVELKAKVKALEGQLARFGELSEVLSEMGMMPR